MLTPQGRVTRSVSMNYAQIYANDLQVILILNTVHLELYQIKVAAVAKKTSANILLILQHLSSVSACIHHSL